MLVQSRKHLWLSLTKPVDRVDKTFKYIEECIDDPVGQPLSIVNFACAEQGVQGVVSRNDKSCKVHEELSTDVEEDQKEVDSDESEEGVHLGDAGLLLEIVESRVFGQLSRDTCQQGLLITRGSR
jgi:hypothetical protein